MTPTSIILLICAERFRVIPGNAITKFFHDFLKIDNFFIISFLLYLIGRRYGRTAGWHMPIPRVST
jgi:hypothetical protein